MIALQALTVASRKRKTAPPFLAKGRGRFCLAGWLVPDASKQEILDRALRASGPGFHFLGLNHILNMLFLVRWR